MTELKTYTVTKLAGPKVAGQAAKAGDELQLTEAQARTELLAGALVEKTKDGETAKADPLKGSEKLDDIRARAVGLEKAPKTEIEKPAAEAAPADAGKARGAKPAATETPEA